MATNLTVYKTQCDICPSTFNTTTALMRHRCSKHRTDAEPITSLPFYNGQEVLRLPPTIRTGPRSFSYKQWITGIVDSLNSCLHPKAAGMYFKLIFLSHARIAVRKCVRIRLLNERASHIVKHFLLILITSNAVVTSQICLENQKKTHNSAFISLRCGRMNGRMRDKRLTQSPCKFERRQLNVPYTTIFIRLRHVKSKWPSLLVERFTQFGRFVKFLKMFFEVDHNPKGI